MMHITKEHPWVSAGEHFRRVIMPRLERDGKRIGTAASSGNEAAKDCIKYYEMLRRSFDPMTLTLLEDAMNKWEQS